MPAAVNGPASVFTARKVAAYGAISVLSAVAVVLAAFRQRSNFYSAAVMLGRSNGCMMVLFNFGLFLTLCFGKVCQKVFFGPLRAVEVEHLYERSWYAVTESLLAMTIFRDEFGANFVILFGTLLFLKVFHWLSADRVEYMEQSPSVSRLFHVRMVSVLSILFCIDFFLVVFAIEVVLLDRSRMGIMIMFASEFMIISATLWSTIAKYVINIYDSRSEEPWEGKSMYVFFVDLITDFLKLMTYVAFFALILSFYGLPLNIIRDVYVTARSFFGRLRDFIKYRAATKNMDTRFPDATRQDLLVMSDGTCIICREEMVARGTAEGEQPSQGGPTSAAAAGPSSRGLNETPKKLPCGHIFHFHCLRSWLERQQSCPTCRRTVFTPPNGPPQMGIGSPQNDGAAAPPGGDAGLPDLARTNGGLPTANSSTAADASRTTRDRLQSFLQQIQTDAQRAREQAYQQAPGLEGQQPATHPVAASAASTSDHSSSANPADPPGRSRAPVQRALINSLFGQPDRFGRAAAATSAEASGRRTPGRSGTEQRHNLVAGLIPPAPWVLRGTNPSGASNDSAAVASSSSPATMSSSTPPQQASVSILRTEDKKSETQEESSAPLDPLDAREAARAAALKRFGVFPSGPSPRASPRPTPLPPSSAPVSSTSAQAMGQKERHAEGNSKAGSSTTSRTLPGDPTLVPLFDTASVADYETVFVPHLPFPLTERKLPNLKAAAMPDPSGLESMDSLLQCTPEELRSMSLRNRRGLEERLRLLTRVEGAIGSLVEEMTRALSVVPDDDDVELEQSSAAAKSSSQTFSSDEKGKQAAEGANSNHTV